MIFYNSLLMSVRRLKLELQAAFLALAPFLGARQDRPAIPIPPPRLRFRVHGNFSPAAFHDTGRQVFGDLDQAIQAHVVVTRSLRLLDFGCGCSRVLRHFFEHRPDWVYTGSDPDHQAIAWNQASYPDRAHWIVSKANTPLPICDHSFDVIIAVSVFTHLDHDQQDFWMQELERLLAPDGIVLASIHGESTWRGNPEWRARINQLGFLFIDNQDHNNNFCNFPETYQTAFHSRSYVQRHWSSWFHVLGYMPMAINNHQDMVLLTHRSKTLDTRPAAI